MAEEPLGDDLNASKKMVFFVPTGARAPDGVGVRFSMLKDGYVDKILGGVYKADLVRKVGNDEAVMRKVLQEDLDTAVVMFAQYAGVGDGKVEAVVIEFAEEYIRSAVCAAGAVWTLGLQGKISAVPFEQAKARAKMLMGTVQRSQGTAQQELTRFSMVRQLPALTGSIVEMCCEGVEGALSEQARTQRITASPKVVAVQPKQELGVDGEYVEELITGGLNFMVTGAEKIYTPAAVYVPLSRIDPMLPDVCALRVEKTFVRLGEIVEKTSITRIRDKLQTGPIPEPE